MKLIKEPFFSVGVIAASILLLSVNAAEPIKKNNQPTSPKINQPQIKNPQIKNPSVLPIAEQNALRKELNSHALEYSNYKEKLKQHRIKARDMELVRSSNKVQAQTSLRSQNDQWVGTYDCNDMDTAVNPGQAEVCDGIDNDCDGDVDENVTANLFLDADGDGWGDPDKRILACHEEDGYASRGNDCDDRNIQIYPGASDVEGDGIDANCDGNDG
ncbi:MAG: putative metal-binding motif-containing protein [Gammaproteobacteria bacterium]|nr:putative metal-binding motif-containing protein [Gammaproteobacteria bacterium]